jgi:rare lipoprotein A (peptidoglycan hydrolase)
MSASSSRVIDVSWAAAKKLNFVRDGLAQVELTLIDTIPLK